MLESQIHRIADMWLLATNSDAVVGMRTCMQDGLLEIQLEESSRLSKPLDRV